MVIPTAGATGQPMNVTNSTVLWPFSLITSSRKNLCQIPDAARVVLGLQPLTGLLYKKYGSSQLKHNL